jgi:hypothetical protein
MTVTVNGTSGVTFSDGSSMTTSPFSGGVGFRNRIINGAMAINQRGGTITPASGGTYGIDRFYGYASGGGVFTAVQSTDAPTGAGFSYSNLLTVTTADSSIASTDYYSAGQMIEGYNIADLLWGTANAKAVTLSFWVKSSVTGSYSACLYNVDGSRCYPAGFTISSANTWQQIVLTIAGDVGGTWNITNGLGIGLRIDLGSGSGYNGTANTWNTSGSFVGIRTSANVNWIATNGATFYYTGVQLEKGSAATAFDYRPYGLELMLCQRYYYVKYSQVDFALGFSGTVSAQMIMNFPVTMRAAPTMANDTASNFICADGAGGYTVSAIAYTSDINSSYPVPSFTGGTNGRAIMLRRTAGTPWISASAEL